jgi:hypothetical protein
MASINISEDDFGRLFNAANDALLRGDVEAAEALDKIARKMNAALSHDAPMARIARANGGRGKSVTWREMPTTLQR